MPTEKDYKVIEKATIYDLRLIFTNGEKDTYTREEIVELLDKIAMAKTMVNKMTGRVLPSAAALTILVGTMAMRKLLIVGVVMSPS